MLLTILLFCSLSTHSQSLLQGIVLDAGKDKPIPSASVFLSNTSIGTKTNDEGRFELWLPNGKSDLVVSSIGYATYSQTVTPGQLSGTLTIRLKPRSEELETVVIAPYEKNGWNKWGRFFVENFMGTMANAQQCTIANTGTIRFRYSKKNNELSAYAASPLLIENKALGYIIHYQLETFTYDFSTHTLLYVGYPFFEPMKGTRARERKWEKRRSELYKGSLMHFMRSLFRNRIVEEGYEVRTLKKFPNLEKQRVKQAYAANQHTSRSGGKIFITAINKDTAEYYDHILAQDDYQDVVARNLLTGDSIAYAIDSSTAGFAFPNYLLVIYKHKLAPPEYREQFPRNSTAMMSQLLLTNGVPVEVQASGSYFNPADLMLLGYWSWSEKIADMLPFNYQPPKE